MRTRHMHDTTTYARARAHTHTHTHTHTLPRVPTRARVHMRVHNSCTSERVWAPWQPSLSGFARQGGVLGGRGGAGLYEATLLPEARRILHITECCTAQLFHLLRRELFDHFPGGAHHQAVIRYLLAFWYQRVGANQAVLSDLDPVQNCRADAD